jgi:DNA-binding transcriptional MocR family regulator
MIRDALAHVAQNATARYADYPDPDHNWDTLAAIATWLGYTDMTPDPDNIALTYGAQNAMLIALQTILVGPTPVIVTDELVYPGLRHAANILRADIISVERDTDGMLPDALEQACRKHGPQVLVSSFTIHSPTTQTTTLERRIALARIAAKYEMQIIDDDAFGIFSSDSPCMQTIAPERTWYIGALSKSVSTGLRIGYLITPNGHGPAARTTVLSNCYGVSQIICDLAAQLITSGQAEVIRTRMLAYNERRAKMAANVLGQWDIQWNPKVAFIWLKMPSGWRASSFQRACEQNNILIRPADEFALFDGKAPNAARITFGATLTDTEFETALQSIAKILQTRPDMIGL